MSGAAEKNLPCSVFWSDAVNIRVSFSRPFRRLSVTTSFIKASTPANSLWSHTASRMSSLDLKW